MLAAVPVKPFGVAKRRLGLDPQTRSQMGKAVAAHTISVLARCELDVAVITADDGVAAWAGRHDAAVIADPGTGLDDAAAAAVESVDGPWVIIHADLPILTESDVVALIDAVPVDGAALAPAADGGTTAIAADLAHFRFAYGPGSFARHLAAIAGRPHAVVSRPGLALDLDTPSDLEQARALADPVWLRTP